MAEKTELETAFDEALAEVNRMSDKGMTTVNGGSAVWELDQLATELKAECGRAVERGRVDREWFQKTLKWVVGWVPESNLTLIAALGRIARVRPSRLS